MAKITAYSKALLIFIMQVWAASVLNRKMHLPVLTFNMPLMRAGMTQ